MKLEIISKNNEVLQEINLVRTPEGFLKDPDTKKVYFVKSPELARKQIEELIFMKPQSEDYKNARVELVSEEDKDNNYSPYF